MVGIYCHNIILVFSVYSYNYILLVFYVREKMDELTAEDLENAIKYLGMDKYSEEEWKRIYRMARKMKNNKQGE